MRYDYFCPKNGRTIEVQHGMLEEIHTWGELCSLAEIDTGSTSADSPVQRLVRGGILALSRRISKEKSDLADDPVLHSDDCAPQSKCCAKSH